MMRIAGFLVSLAVFAAVAADDTTDREFHLHWRNCALEEGVVTLRVVQDDNVTLHLHADRAVEFHLHGYDAFIDVPAEGENRYVFTADIAGRFPVGVHSGCSGDHGHRTAFYLEVMPE